MTPKERERALKAAAVAIAAQILEKETSPVLLTYDDVAATFGLGATESICAALANAIEAALAEDTRELWDNRVAVSFFALTREGRHVDITADPTQVLHVVLRAKEPMTARKVALVD